MGKSIRSKVKRRFRAVRRAKYEPIVQKMMEKNAEVVGQVLEGKVKSGDLTDPLDKWLTTYGDDIEKKIKDAPLNENDIDTRGSEFVIDMNKQKMLTSAKALQGPVFKPETHTGKMDLKTALKVIGATSNQGNDSDDVEMKDRSAAKVTLRSGKMRRNRKRKSKKGRKTF